MALTNYQIIEGATLNWQADLDAGIAEGKLENDFSMLVRPMAGVQSITDPISRKTTLVWFDQDGELDEDNGQVVFRNLPTQRQEMEIKPYSKGYEEELPKLREPLVLDMYSRQAGSLGVDIAYTQYRTCWKFLREGDTATRGLAFDGQFFFDTDHPGATEAGVATTYSNLHDLSLSEVNLTTVIDAMSEFRNPFGVPWGNRWKSSTQQPQTDRNTRAATPTFHLYVGPANQTVAQSLANMAQENPGKYAGTFTWSVEHALSGAYDGYWFVQFNSTRRKPLCFLDAGSVVLPSVGPDTEQGRIYNKAQWVVRAEFGVCFDQWHCISMARD